MVYDFSLPQFNTFKISENNNTVFFTDCTIIFTYFEQREIIKFH